MPIDAKQDPLFEAVKQLVIKTRNPSVSTVQREFRLNYSRAASMLEAMEGEIVTTKDGNGWRRMLTGETKVDDGGITIFSPDWVDAGMPSHKHRVSHSMSFDNFVTGKANQLAHAAALQVAESPEITYNPLFIYGDVGLGKTHLLHAIGNRFKLKNPQTRICYVHATNYISEVVRAYLTNQFDEFRNYYHSLDMLLIDDIQFIDGKTKTQYELICALNSLMDAKKLVVISCVTSPNEMSEIEPQLISRFSGGLTVAVEQPDLETQAAILLQKSTLAQSPIDKEVAFFIAKHVTSDIRKLKGALTRVEAFAKFHNRTITVDLAEEALNDLIASR
jgi:chromosomal replication initiator protein